MKRDDWLRLPDHALLAQCEQRRFRASGPGGQRRNKVETAVRLLHRPSGVTAQAAESRSMEVNRTAALRRLRMRLAFEVREPLESLPVEFLAQRGGDGSLSVNPHNPAYPLIVGTVLDALAAAHGRHAQAAKALGLTTSQLRRFLESDRELWRAVARMGDNSDRGRGDHLRGEIQIRKAHPAHPTDLGKDPS